MNLTVPAAVSALSSAFLKALEGGSPDFAEWEAAALELGRRCVAEAMGAALEARDRELRHSLPAGLRIHSVRSRTLATPTGDVRFRRTVCVDADGFTRYPLDEALDLPAGDRVSPGARELLVATGIEVSFERAARILALHGGSRVSAQTVMRSVRACGEEVAAREREAARALFEDGERPTSEMLPAPELLVEADGTYVRMRDGSTAEVKAVVAYAGKDGRGRKRERRTPVRHGCVGEAPGDFWEQAVARIGSRYDLASVERCLLGADGEAQYLDGGMGALRFPSVEARIDPFHLDRAVSSCFPAGSALGSQAVSTLWGEGPGRCSRLLRLLAASGDASRDRALAVARYLDAHAAQIGGDGPSMGTMEAEQQHLYKVRMAAFPCAWSVEGADAMARLRSWVYSGSALPRRTREGSLSATRLKAREARLDASPRMKAARAVKSEGKGWEYPLRASLTGLRADVRYEAGWYADRRLGNQH